MIEKKVYDINNLGTFEDEWLYHEKAWDSWYSTGYFSDSEGKKYSFQFTILHLNFGDMSPYMAMVALTDFQTNQHRYRQEVNLSGGDLSVDQKKVVYSDVISLEKREDAVYAIFNHKDFKLELRMEYGKGAFWHCEDGKLRMAYEDGRATNFYYSYTNMPTTGTLTIDGKKLEITGKSWMDKQGGDQATSKENSWEWFSLRFYDDEEMMLYTFPLTGYQDGTFISKEATRERLNNYTLKAIRYIEHEGIKWSAGWELNVPGKKEEHYTIMPIMDGSVNLGYFEELCSVKNSLGEEVGLCFVELLPGIHDDTKLDYAYLLQSIEY